MAGKKRQSIVAELGDFSKSEEEIKIEGTEPPTLVKSILNVLNGPKDSVERLAFESDPTTVNQFHSVYKQKMRLIPDSLLKRIAIQDDLVAAILQARQNQVSTFGRPRPDRFSEGYIIEPKTGVIDKLTDEQKQELDKRIDQAIARFETCGDTRGWSDNDAMTLAQWLSMSARNALCVGRIATEIIWVMNADGTKRFHSFRPIDAGTIYRATPQKSAQESIRKQAFYLLQSIKNKKLIPEKFNNDEYSWIQVIDGKPEQVFTSEECVVSNFYAVPDVELDGYPVTPLDTIISAVTTHINITSHNKLYFQSGRAARGMLIITSDDASEHVIQRIRQQFNASINNVNNSWRMPVFGIAQGDTVDWKPIDNSNRDMEFQYLMDMNARVILSAFQMSPDELPGWSYLSRGTNNQSLSESNNEYKLEAARDLGIRPLLQKFEDFINSVIFPLIDPQLAKLCRFKLMGMDAETAEKESVRLQQDLAVHMTYNQVLEKVEKKPISVEMGGDFPLNPQYQEILDKLYTVDEQKQYFCGAKPNPDLAYYRDDFWFKFQDMKMQAAQMQQQQQMAQQQAAMGQDPNAAQPAGPGEAGGDQQEQPGQPSGNKPYPDAKTETQKSDDQAQASASGQPQDTSDLTRSIDMAVDLLTKSESQLPPSKRRLLTQQKRTINDFMKGLEEDLKQASKDILDIAEKHTPKDK